MSADGAWNVTINSPMGAQQATMTLVTDGSSLSGKMEGAQGTQEFAGGTVDARADRSAALGRRRRGRYRRRRRHRRRRRGR